MSRTEYELTVGLEIHAELKTKSKMFCSCKNDPDEEKPNVNVCPVCMGHPGTLPVINKEAVKSVVRIGVAVGGKIATDFTEWDRKNYFYPDIPKGYQISQYKFPLVSGGEIGGVQLTRIHLEEDTGTSLHDRGDFSLLNYNRAGVPLMELVTEPVIKSAEQAGIFARELRMLLITLDASEANMEKGEMRVEANISVAPKGAKEFGTKVEVKNLNSFKAMEKAIAYEMERHIDLIESGEKVVQETRGWNETTGKTFSQRAKENSNDYRYFPDPDLPKLKLSELPEFDLEKIKAELPELPWEKRTNLEKVLGHNLDQIEFFVNNQAYFDILSTIISQNQDANIIKTCANYLSVDTVSLMKGENKKLPSVEQYLELAGLIKSGDISSRGAKDILAIMISEGGNPREIAEKNNLIQKSDSTELAKIIEQVISANQKVVDEYKAGKEASLQFLVGQGMKLSKGSANPQVLAELFKKSI